MGNINCCGLNKPSKNRSRRSHARSASTQSGTTANPEPVPYNLYLGVYPLPSLLSQSERKRSNPLRLPGGSNSYGSKKLLQEPCIEHQKVSTLRNFVNLRKKTLRLELDEEHPGMFLVSFTFDASAAGTITIIFFATEGKDGTLSAMKENLLPPLTVTFQPGMSQKFRQPSGTGINLAMFEETELLKVTRMYGYPLAVKAEAFPKNQNGSYGRISDDFQVTMAVFDKNEGEYRARIVKRALWKNGVKLDLHEIYQIENSVDEDVDTHNKGHSCVICLSEPQDTIVLACRHMCLCSKCAQVLRFQTNRCPICGQPAEMLLEMMKD